MTSRVLPAGLRAQLALAIALVTAAGVIASFLALYGGTTSRLRGQIDAQLNTQAAEWRQFAKRADLSPTAALERTAGRFITNQRYHAESLINVIQVSGGGTVSNNPEILAREERRGEGPARPVGLLDSPTGISTASVAEAGNMRVLAQQIVSDGKRVGTLRVANPLTPVSQAQSSLRRTFVVVGTLAVVLAVIAGIALASLISAPLRRITAVAAAATEGDLSHRAGPVSSRGEVGVLARAFDEMLNRLERAFTRQRDFVSDASHELRTPLSVLRAQVEVLDRESDEQKLESHITQCMALAGVRNICMTNSPFDDAERKIWEKGVARDERFTAALRIDELLLAWPATAPKLANWGYSVEANPGSGKTYSEVRRFLADWTKRINARYLMVSLPPDFAYPAKTEAAGLIEHAVLPHCRESGLPFALMPGVKRAVNPQLKLAGDGCGLSDLSALKNLCAQFPENKFLATVLARENQHELCVLARKFRNLHIFGCWWFTNVPLLVDEMTRMRIELLGLSFTPQHSDARVLEQMVYKWRHNRQAIAKILVEKYTELGQSGWQTSRAEVERDVKDLFGGAFERFCGT